MHSERQSGPGDVLRAAPRWTSWFFYVLLGLVLAALVAASVIEVDRYARGPTGADARERVIVFLPASVAPHVSEGSRVEIGDTTTEVVATTDEVLDPAEIRRRYGVDVATPSVAVQTPLVGTPEGIARVLVESDPIIIQFVPGLDSLFGGEGA